MLCLSSESTLIQIGVRHGRDLEVHRCNQCGLVFLWPRPNHQELTSYYAEDYRTEYGDPSRDRQCRVDIDEARLRARRVLPFVTAEFRLLDLGCGSGAFLDSIRPHVREVVGAEPDEQ